jgi:hypothetical protein
MGGTKNDQISFLYCNGSDAAGTDHGPCSRYNGAGTVSGSVELNINEDIRFADPLVHPGACAHSDPLLYPSSSCCSLPVSYVARKRRVYPIGGVATGMVEKLGGGRIRPPPFLT